MKELTLAMVLVVLCGTVSTATELRAEYFSNMGGAGPPPDSGKASATALRGLAMVIEAVASLEMKETKTARQQLDEAARSLDESQKQFEILAESDASRVLANFDRLTEEQKKVLYRAASETNVKLDASPPARQLFQLTAGTIALTAGYVRKFAEAPNTNTYATVRDLVSWSLIVGEVVSLALQ
jgi:hypothetical protein